MRHPKLRYNITIERAMAKPIDVSAARGRITGALLLVLLVLLAVAEVDVMDVMGPSAWVDVTFAVVVVMGFVEAVALVFVPDAVFVMVKLIVETPVPLQRLLYAVGRVIQVTISRKGR
ncbi:hypothetical protein M378DRAFT_18362 [Amanita muscaria Koide BX008]|uniref:Uncharacterized protein n=1 Tax=Amanita muscaria (strain Koide BX008) TaxID=946122 RepID=A0A0C2WFU7_AMAMK|nr:hypothetical protein M378DRAFT_18362 [Amanita muscaria Koide BX008]